MAASACTPIFATRKKLQRNYYELANMLNDSSSTKIVSAPAPAPAPAPISETKEQEAGSGMESQPQPNYWERIIKRNAHSLYHLPVPPKYFDKRERKASKAIGGKEKDRCQVKLKDLLRGEKQGQIPAKKPNQCFRWVLLPMTEKPPEPMPGVPAITVTDPNGKTWWPKDPNSYITGEKLDQLAERHMTQHRGLGSKAHCTAFKEARRKRMGRKPIAMQPEVLCCSD